MTIFYFNQTFATNTEWLCSWNRATVFDSFLNQEDTRQEATRKLTKYFEKKLY